MSRSLDVLTALVAEGIKKQMTPNRRYLAAPERVAIADDDRFMLQHPLTERLTGGLFDCEIHDRIANGEPLAPGRYRVRIAGADLDLAPMGEYA